jgi:hypothetical protein
MENLLEKLIKERDALIRRGMELSSLQSQEQDQIIPAFIASQMEFGPVLKTHKSFVGKYAVLEDILEMVTPILNKYGLAFRQYSSKDGVLHTRITHISGQFFESQFTVPAIIPEEYEKSKEKLTLMQQIGSRRTYARRYETLTILGLQPQNEDNDASYQR